MRKVLSTLGILGIVWLACRVAAEEPTPPRAADGKAANGNVVEKKPEKAASLSEFAGKSFDQWKRDLRHPDASVRVEAIIAMTAFSSLAAEVVPLLVERCLDRDASPRVKAVVALSMVEVDRKDISKVVDALAKRIAEDGQSIVRYQAAVTLQRFADEVFAKQAINALLKGCEDTASYEIRALCLSLLRQIARDTKTGPEYRVSNVLIRACKDNTAQVRMEAAMAMGALGRSADPQMQEQIERSLQLLTRDRDKIVAVWAQVGLLAHAEQVKEAEIMTVAQPLLSQSDVRLKIQIARALAAMGPKAKVATPTLLRSLEDRDPEVVAESILALVSIGDANERVLRAIGEVGKRKGVDAGLKELSEAAVEQMKKSAAEKK